MRNYLKIGPVRIKLTNKGQAKWGYPLVEIGGLSLFIRDSGGGFMPAAYHPRRSLTWLWLLSFKRGKPMATTDFGGERGQRDFRLPFGWVLHYAWQKEMPRKA